MTQLVPVPYKKHYKAEHCFDVKEYDYTMGNRIKWAEGITKYLHCKDINGWI